MFEYRELEEWAISFYMDAFFFFNKVYLKFFIYK